MQFSNKGNVFDEGYFHGKGSNYPEEGYETVLLHYWIAQKLSDFAFGLKRRGRLLDVGCAYGFLVKTAYERGIDAFGVDISSYAINQGQQLNRSVAPRLSVVAAEDVAKKFDEESFDMIIAMEIVEHLPCPEIALAGFYKLLKKGGLLVLTTPSPESDATFTAKDVTHISVKPRYEWERVLQQIGFKTFSPFHLYPNPQQNQFLPTKIIQVLDSNVLSSTFWRTIFARFGLIVHFRTPHEIIILAAKSQSKSVNLLSDLSTCMNRIFRKMLHDL